MVVTAMATAMGTDSRWRSAAFVVLTVALIFAPLAWGSVTQGTERVLFCLLFLAALLGEIAWLVEPKSNGRSTRWPLLFWCFVLAIVWIAALNPRSHYDESVWEFVGTESFLGILPARDRKSVV